MAYAGSVLARKTLNELGMRCAKIYTEPRAKTGRTYKIFGVMDHVDADCLVAKLANKGAKNVRKTKGGYNDSHCRGVRFEL